MSESVGPPLSKRLVWSVIHLLIALPFVVLAVMLLAVIVWGESGEWNDGVITLAFLVLLVAAVVAGQLWLGTKTVRFGPFGMRVREVEISRPQLTRCELRDVDGELVLMMIPSAGSPTLHVARPSQFDRTSRAHRPEPARSGGATDVQYGRPRDDGWHDGL